MADSTKRRKSAGDSGRIIRVSDEVYEALQKKRARGFRSWDSCVRWLLGMPVRTWRTKQTARTLSHPFPETLREYWIVPGSIRFFRGIAQARGEAVRQAALNETAEIPKPIRMREVL